MANSTYQPPIDKLLTLGSQQINDVAELGFGSEHIPDLIKMAVDKELLGASDDKEVWAPIHAWRILGQLQATNAIVPLIQLFQLEDNDLVNEELPKVYGNIGNAAIPELTKYLISQENQLLARVTAINSLEEIANQHADARNEVISVLTQSLQSCNQNPSELNGFIISALINLQALISVPVIKYAFNTNQVAEDIVGNWDEVRENLGIASDELQEFQPQASQQLTDTDTNTEIETPTPPPSITEASAEDAEDVEQQREDEITALINLMTEVTETETSTQDIALPTPDEASEVIETETLTEENTLPTTESASEVTETETQENALPTTELASEVNETEPPTGETASSTSDNASELADIETQAQENALATPDNASQLVETQTSTEENVLPAPDNASQVTETETQENALPTTELASEVNETEPLTGETASSTSDNASELADIETQTQESTLATTESASETVNTILLQKEPEVQQEIIDTEQNLTNTIDQVEDEIKEVASEIEASKETQVIEASTQIDESHEQTKAESIKTATIESHEELNLLEQEDNKGFGRPTTSKEKPEKPHKAKPSKKKKRGFSDL